MTPTQPDFSRRQVGIGDAPASTNGAHGGAATIDPEPQEAVSFHQGEIVASDDDVAAEEEAEMTEAQVIAGMIAAATDKTKITERIRVVRNQPDGSKRLYFVFEIHGLDDPENEQAYRGASEITSGRGGAEIVRRTHMADMRSRLIYAATVGTKGAKIWDNREVRKAAGAMNGIEVIDKMLFSVEKDEIINRIERLSGAGATLVDPLSD